MDFWRTVMVLFRRWYITVPAFFLTLFAAFAAGSAVPIQYQSSTVLVLTTPLHGGTETTNPDAPKSLTNPLLSFDQSLALTVSIVIQQLNSSESAVALGVIPGGTPSYEVTNGTTNPELLQSGPLLFIVTKAPSPEAAQDLANKVATMAATVLDQRQTELNAPPSTHIGVQVVVPATAGVPLADSPLRAAAAVGALAGAASLAAVYGFESLMTHRRRRRAEKERVAEQDDPFSPGGSDEGDLVGATANRSPSGRSAQLDAPGSTRLPYETPPGAVDGRVNGASSRVGR